MYVSVYVRKCMCVYVYIDLLAVDLTYLHMHTYIHTYMKWQLDVGGLILVSQLASAIHTHTHIQTHIHTPTYIHTYTHTHQMAVGCGWSYFGQSIRKCQTYRDPACGSNHLCE